MIAALALAAALTLTAPVDDVQLPTCAVGEEAVPFEDGYVCGPADPVLPEPLPTFTAEPAPVPAQPTPTDEPTPVVDAPSPAPPAPQLPRLAETGVVEDRLGALAYFGIGILGVGAGLLCSVWIAGLRRRRDARSSYARLRDANGYYTKLKPTDPGYPYGASASESEDEALDALGLPKIPGQTSGPVRVDMPSHRVNGLPKKIQLSSQAAKRRRLGPGESENRELLLSPDGEVDDVVSSTHDASPSVLDDEVAPSSSSDQTVGETADTAAMGSFLPFGSQRTVGGRGAAASSGPAAPHFDLEGEQQ